MKRLILLSVLLSSLALARYYEFDLEKASDPLAQESYGIPQDHEVYLADVKVPWGLIGEAGWVQIGYEKTKDYTSFYKREPHSKRTRDFNMEGPYFRTSSHLGIIQQSTDLKASKPNRYHS